MDGKRGDLLDEMGSTIRGWTVELDQLDRELDHLEGNIPDGKASLESADKRKMFVRKEAVTHQLALLRSSLDIVTRLNGLQE